jgi:putative oxidoreductase
MNAIGRIFISAIFIITGVMHLLHFHEKALGLGAKGVPFPEFFLACAVVLMIGGAILLITGQRVKLAAIALLVFLIPTTLLYHNFWAVPAAESQNQLIQFLKNLAIMGGLLVILSPEKRS